MIYEAIKEGTRIKVVKPGRYKDKTLVGMLGTVRRNSSFNDLQVLLDERTNSASAVGAYYFKRDDLIFVEDYTDILRDATKMQYITNYLNVAKIQFVDGNNSATYDYANFDSALEAGDMCVVMSAHNGLGVARVVEIVDRNDIKTTREVVAKVFTDAYDARVKNRARAAELKTKMQERARQLQDIALYQMLAETDPDMKGLLQQYQTIENLIHMH